MSRPPFTDPRWDPASGGLRSDTCAAGAPGVAVSTTGATLDLDVAAPTCTITPPEPPSWTVGPGAYCPPREGYAESLSPSSRARLERILLDLDVVRERLRKMLERR